MSNAFKTTVFDTETELTSGLSVIFLINRSLLIVELGNLWKSDSWIIENLNGAI